MLWLCLPAIHGCPVISIDSSVVFATLMANATLVSTLYIICVLTESLLCLELLALSLKVPRLTTVVARPLF
jgi:hypothetical protein